MEAALQIETKPGRLAASGRFGIFRPEVERNVRASRLESNPVMAAMRAAWTEFYSIDSMISFYWMQDAHAKLSDRLKSMEYSAKDIETFCIVLSEFQGEEKFQEKAGVFLSALINNSPEDRFVIHTAHLVSPVASLGYWNTKDILVEGGVGDSAGHWMQGGTMMVHGDSGNNLGDHMSRGTILINGGTGKSAGNMMEGGSITIKGNADRNSGNEMRGGSIMIEGDAADNAGYVMKGGSLHVGRNAGDRVGVLMQTGRITIIGRAGNDIGLGMIDGEIHLNDGYGSISQDIPGGRIFHKGELVVCK